MKRRDFVQDDVLRRPRHVRPAGRQLRAGRSRTGRFVFILLRGGFDGLAALVPYGDPDYRALRGTFAYNASDLSTLDDTFGLAPGLSPLRALWDAGQLAVVHAMAIPHRTRSHFDGQAILETGLDRPAGSVGWLAEPAAAGDVGHAHAASRSRPACRCR